MRHCCTFDALDIWYLKDTEESDWSGGIRTYMRKATGEEINRASVQMEDMNNEEQ